MKNTTQLRFIYGVLSLFLLGVEVIIALFVRDSFIRPYGGDVLVTLLLCCMARCVIPLKIRWLPFGVFLFSVLVEVGQYFDFATLLGFSNNPVFKVALGSSFSVADIFCYALGCFSFVLVEKVIRENKNYHS